MTKSDDRIAISMEKSKVNIADKGYGNESIMPKNSIEDVKIEDVMKKDGVWCWIVCLAAFIIVFLRNGILVSFGIMFPVLLKTYKESRSKTALVGSTALFFAFFFGPLASVLSRRFGAHVTIITGGVLCTIGLVLTSFASQLVVMFFSYGVIAGFGCCLSFAPVHVVLTTCFKKNRSLAINLASSGSNFATIAMGPLVDFLLHKYGWSTTNGILAAQSLLIILCGLAFRPSSFFAHKQKTEKLNISTFLKDCFAFEMFKKRIFIAFLIAVGLRSIATYVPKTYLIDYAEKNGISHTKSSQLYIYFGVAGIAGKLIVGLIANSGKISSPTLCQICMFVSGLTAMLTLLSSSYNVLAAFAVFYGMADGAYSGILSLATLDVVGEKMLSHSWGIILCLQSLAFLIGNPLTGIFNDLLNSTKPMFYCIGIFSFGSCFVMLFITCRKRKREEFFYESM